MAILPKPICPIFILLLGAFFPKTEEGTIDGKIIDPVTQAELLLRNSRRSIFINFKILLVS